MADLSTDPSSFFALDYLVKRSRPLLQGGAIQIFTAQCTLVQRAVLRSHVVCLSVRLSVRRSVTLVDCDHIGWSSLKLISPLVSLGCSLFATPT